MFPGSTVQQAGCGFATVTPLVMTVRADIGAIQTKGSELLPEILLGSVTMSDAMLVREGKELEMDEVPGPAQCAITIQKYGL